MNVVEEFGTELPSIGDHISTWFSDREDGYSIVMDEPEKYTGRYPESFTHVLRVTAPRTQRGWMEILFKLEAS